MQKISVKTEFVNLFDEKPFVFESGRILKNIRVAYQTYGKLNKERDNVVVIFHALTGNAHAAGILTQIETSSEDKYDYLKKYSTMSLNKVGWWDGIIGPDKAIDTNKYFVVCANILGGCYGTTGALSINPETLSYFGKDFPTVTVRDIVKVQKELLDYLKVESVYCTIGGSLGGMQCLEFGIMYPEFVKNIVPIACHVKNTDWAIAFNEIQRNVIFSDPSWNNGNYSEDAINNLGIARMVGLLSYRCPQNYDKKFLRKRQNNDYFDTNNKFDISNYFNYQGQKFINRFDPNSYVTITYATDLHDVTYGRGNLEDVLGEIKAKTWSIAVDTDILYPATEQEEFAKLIPKASHFTIESEYGHDAFLIENEQITAILHNFL